MKRFIITSVLIWSLFPYNLLAKIWINELMQSNIDLVRDDLQEFPDSWIELYNDSDESVNIRNWVISDVNNYQSGWKITGSTVISPKSYLLIYADKAAVGLHTHYRLDSNGGSVYLYNESGMQIDAVRNIPKQPAPNIAWGRKTDGNDSWAYFVTATPGKENTGKTSNILLPAVIFSKQGGIFRESVSLSLSLPALLPNGVDLSCLHYTLDNSEPTENSPVYTGEMEISQTTVVRAKVIHPDYLINRSAVNSYIITDKIYDLPVISISTDPAYLWDEEFGIYCEGNGKYGLTGNGVDYPVNWNNNWRRPINFEYFSSENSSGVLNQLCEMRISGGWSRANPQKSFIVYTKKRFGTNRFYYDIFKDKPNQEIKSFMIRNSGNDFWDTHFRDAAIQLFLGGKVDIDYQAYQPAIFYLNGVFWGIQNLRERSDEDFVLANYGLEDIDVIGDWWGDVKAGDRTNWNQLMTELRRSHLQRDYQWIVNQIDIDEFINYMILQVYISNLDFPGNNMVMWRPRETGGKWRFIVKDTDLSLGIFDSTEPSHNALEYNTQDEDDSRKLFNALLTQDTFRKKFYSRFAIYMGDLLHYNSTSQIIDSIQKLIEPAMPDHIDRWLPYFQYGDMERWYYKIYLMKKWLEGRNEEVYKHLQDFFGLGDILPLKFEKADDLAGNPVVSINGVHIRDFGLDASCFQKEKIDLYYEGDTPLYGWEITQTVDGIATVETYMQQDLSYEIVDGCTSVIINLVNNNFNSIKQLEMPEIILYVFDNNLQISNIQIPSIVSIYDISGRLITETAATNHSIIIPFNQKGIFIVKVQGKAQRFVTKVVMK